MLIHEYVRTLGRAKEMLIRRPGTQLLVIQHSNAISDLLVTAEKVTSFSAADLTSPDGSCDRPHSLHRNRAGISS